jgi:hypothetical protein
MEIREEILENKNDQIQINLIKQKIKKLIAEEMLIISDLLTEEKYQEAAQKLIKLKYLDKIIFDLKTI